MIAAAPEVVVLCGSTRFRDAFEQEQRRLTLEGRIVISVGSSTRSEIEYAQQRGIAVTYLEPTGRPERP